MKLSIVIVTSIWDYSTPILEKCLKQPAQARKAFFAANKYAYDAVGKTITDIATKSFRLSNSTHTRIWKRNLV